jgi:hypothetical protein
MGFGEAAFSKEPGEAVAEARFLHSEASRFLDKGILVYHSQLEQNRGVL